MMALRIFRTKRMVWVGIIFLLPLLGGCQDDEFPDEVRTINDAYAAIVGDWEWVRSMRGHWVGETVSPESEGVTRQCNFSKNRFVRFIENAKITRETEYRIEFQSSAFLLRLMDTNGSLHLIIRSDTLTISNPALGHSDTYIRK